MIPQFGISIESLPYTLENFEAVLLFHEYPTTTIYKDNEGYPIIKEWVDCSEDSKIDRYYYYKIDRILLKRFLFQEIPYIELINKNIDGYFVFEDSSSKGTHEYFISTIKTIPGVYLPQEDFYFDPEDAVDLQIIIGYFKLEELVVPDIGLVEAKYISHKKTSETLLFHLKKGKGIGFGTANTEILANALLKFDKFYKETALDYKLGSQRGDIQIHAKKNAEYLPSISTEVYGNIAASYAVLLRPITPPQLNLFENSEAENISAQVFSLINNSESIDTLKDEYRKHSDFAIRAYKTFIEEVYSSELNISLNWFSPISKTEFVNYLDHIKANTIKNNIENLSIDAIEDFTVKGKFRSVNCDTGHFTFVSTGGERYYGHMDDLIKEGSELITFIDLYEISISRMTTKEAGNQVAKIKDTIMRFTVEK